MAHACNPNTLGGQSEPIMRSGIRGKSGQHDETPSLLKIQKLIWAWWHAPIVPVTWEAEAGELFEPGWQRLQCAKIIPPHSSWVKEGGSISIKKKRKEKKKNIKQ